MAKITDRILAEYMLADTAEFRDRQQYGNEKGVSLNHLLLKMINKILTAVDRNAASEKYAVVLTMLDMAQAFERQSHLHGVQAFIDQGVRPSLIPVLIDFFTGRDIVVKWKGTYSSPKEVAGGGAQGVNAGIIEYLAQTAGNLSFLPEDEAWKFVDDSSFIEVVNLAMVGLSSYNVKQQVPSDMAVEEHFLPPANIKTQEHLDRISEWAAGKQMIINPSKTKYMVINFCNSVQFQTRLTVNGKPIKQVSECRLLEVNLYDRLMWELNTTNLVPKPTK